MAGSDLSEDIIEDGFGNAWSKICPECGQDTIEVVRPGKVQCNAQTGPCSLPFCSSCGQRHEKPVFSFSNNRKEEMLKNCPCDFVENEFNRWCRVHYWRSCPDPRATTSCTEG